jgi:GNAT superfamily N-acetyltransferase
MWWAHERGTLWVCDLASAPPEPVSASCPASFQQIGSDVGERLSIAMELSSPRDILERMEAGRRCFVAVVNDKIASYAWVSLGCEHVGELERVFTLAKGDRYIWDCATVPEQRGRRLYTALLSYILSILREERVHRVWIGASRDNCPSLQGIVHAGFKPAVTTHYVRLWRFRYLRLGRRQPATSALADDAFRLVARRDEWKIGSTRIGVGGLPIQAYRRP